MTTELTADYQIQIRLAENKDAKRIAILCEQLGKVEY
jgi:hypothetical protein